mgnify:CR=1 FL=1
MMKNNIIGLDTIKAYTNVLIDGFDLLAYNWDYYRQLDEYCLMVDNIRLYYKPKHYYLSVTFSASKIQNGVNFIGYNFNYNRELIDYINEIIEENIPVNVGHLKTWTVNRMDVYVDYAMANKKDVIIYNSCLSKINYSRCKNSKYDTGNQARNKSYCINLYIKKDEIKQRLYGKYKVNKKEKLIIRDRGYNVLRCEIQIRRTYIKKIFGDNRSVVDLINLLSCKKVFSIFIKKIGIDKPFLSRIEMFDRINSSFPSLQGKNIKKFLDYYNKYGFEETLKKYKASTINAYLRMLKKADLNPIYLTGKVTCRINMLYFITIYKCNKIPKVKENIGISLFRYLVVAYYLDRGG